MSACKTRHFSLSPVLQRAVWILWAFALEVLYRELNLPLQGLHSVPQDSRCCGAILAGQWIWIGRLPLLKKYTSVLENLFCGMWLSVLMRVISEHSVGLTVSGYLVPVCVPLLGSHCKLHWCWCVTCCEWTLAHNPVMMHTHEMLFLISLRKNSLQIVFEMQLVDDSCGQKLWAETKEWNCVWKQQKWASGIWVVPQRQEKEFDHSRLKTDLLHLHSRLRWFGDVARIPIGRLLV